MEGSLNDAIHAVSTMDIIDEFGVANMSKNGKVYLLCPGHDDSHFGSCYVDKNDNGYYCYACAEHVNKWEMLKKVSGYTNMSAAEWFFRRAGITHSTRANPLARIIKTIKKVEKHLDNNPIYDDKYVCTESESSYGRIQKGEYLYSEQVCNNPLLELYKTSPTLFADVTISALKAKQAELHKIIAFCDRHQNEFLTIKGGFHQNTVYPDIKNASLAIVEEIEGLIDEVKGYKI